ncbi:hypothetical protein F0415_06790 [Arenimonas fontis]|uniref:Uncharacterized protein n=1 Tax=Arenimonas fontis TaxID=2608255 RepID=A0A5B2ZD09_9GAMM|nr:hypothetical protein F0415_06790 [Arenimonas fontis]
MPEGDARLRPGSEPRRQACLRIQRPAAPPPATTPPRARAPPLATTPPPATTPPRATAPPPRGSGSRNCSHPAPRPARGGVSGFGAGVHTELPDQIPAKQRLRNGS